MPIAELKPRGQIPPKILKILYLIYVLLDMYATESGFLSKMYSAVRFFFRSQKFPLTARSEHRQIRIKKGSSQKEKSLRVILMRQIYFISTILRTLT